MLSLFDLRYSPPEGVDGVNPVELGLVPGVALQHRPAAHLLEHCLQRIQTHLLNLVKVHASLTFVFYNIKNDMLIN